MIHVIAIITAKPGKRDEILEHFRANVPAVHAEKGCIEYGATVDADGMGSFQTKFGPDTFVVVEKWESMDDLKAHGASPHMGPMPPRTRISWPTAPSTSCRTLIAGADLGDGASGRLLRQHRARSKARVMAAPRHRLTK